MNRSSDLVVLAGDRDELPAWVGTLQDWSALGLVHDFVVIALDEVTHRTWRAVLVTEGFAVPVRLQDELAGRRHVSSVGVFSVGHVAVEAQLPDVEASRRLRDEVRQSLTEVPLTWGQVLAVGVTGSWPHVEPSLAWTGGHTVVLAPEHAHSPATGKAMVGADDLLRPLGLTHAAAGLASVVGLWSGSGPGAVEGEPMAGGGRVVLARTFLRHVSTSGTTNELLARVIDVSDRYPVPVERSGRQLQRVSDESGAAASMTERLIAQHAPTLDRSERVTSTLTRERVPFGQMLIRFLRFLGAALRLAPQTFAEAMENEVARVSAPALQGILLGDKSAIQITVRDMTGVSADGEIAPTTTLEVQLDERIALLAGDKRVGGTPRHDVPDLWKDFVAGGLTLLDGHERSKHLPPLSEAGSTAVITDPRRVTPDLSVTFDLPPEAQRYVAVSQIPPNDFERLAIVERTVQEHASNESVPVFAHLVPLMDQWRETASDSYSGRLGRHISDRVSSLRDEALSLQASLRKNADTHGMDEAMRRDQVTLGRLTWAFLLAAVAATGVLTWFATEEALPWKEAAGWIGAVWVIGFGALMTIFLLRQRKLFTLLHERERALTQVEVDHKNLTATLKDLRRLLAIHRQYLDWSSVLAHFLRAPWGGVTEDAERTTELGIGFGLNQRFGRLVEDEEGATEMARQAQALVMEPGWLSTAWQEFMTDLPTFEDRHRVVSDPALLFSDARMGERPVLNVWREAVLATRRMDVAERVLHRVGAYLEDLPQDTGRRVHWIDGSGAAHDDSYPDFVEGVTTRTGGEFLRAVLSETPSSTDPGLVARSVPQDLTGRGGPLVLTQVSDPFPAADLAFCQGLTTGSVGTRRLGEAPQV